jgi:hypothetical protein
MWLNFTLHGQSELHTVVIQFTLLQLVQQIEELFDAIQCAIKGNLPIKLVSPTVLQNILRKVTLHLPDAYVLIAGIKTEDTHQYYELTKVSVVANVHYVKLIISVPLKTAIIQFTLLKIFTLPDQVSSDKSVQFSIDYPYFGLQSSQRDYILFTEADYQHCSKGSITLYSASTPIYNTHLFIFEPSLYFQTASEHRLCQRNLLVNHQTPTLHGHQTLWIYNFPVPRQVTINSHGANGRTSNTLYSTGMACCATFRPATSPATISRLYLNYMGQHR